MTCDSRHGSARDGNFPGIVIDPEINAGKPCIEGTRSDVATVVGALGTGQSFEAVQEAYGVTREQILTALRYASYVTDHLPLRMTRTPESLKSS